MNRPYRFNSFGQKAQTIGSALLGLGVLGVGMALVLNPVAGIAAAAYAAYTYVETVRLAIPSVRARIMAHDVRKGLYAPVDAQEPIVQTATAISNRLGRRMPPEVYTVSAGEVIKMEMPLGLRWLRHIGPVRRWFEENTMSSLYAAVPGANILITTKQALAKKLPQRELEFVIAHEMSHLQTDGFSFNGHAATMAKRAVEILAWGGVVAGGLALAGVALPLGLCAASLHAFSCMAGAYGASKLAINYGQRVIERRADRNALYITRDLKGATAAMDRLHTYEEREFNRVAAVVSGHPVYKLRMSALRKSFEKVSAYPELPPVSPSSSSPKGPAGAPA